MDFPITTDMTPIPWLLDAATPSIRYLALTRLLDLPADDQRVQQALRDVAESGPVPAILAKQGEQGSWLKEHSYYTPKYTSTHWAMILLAELQASRTDALTSMRRGAEFMLEDSKWPIQCLLGNILRYALECGLQGDPRTHAFIAEMAHNALQDGWRCKHNDGLPCAWGAARALWGLAALRERASIPGVEAMLASAVHLLLEEYPLVEASYPTPGERHELWSGLSFPLFYQADILFVLRVLGELDMLDHPGARPALDWLASKRAANGRFTGASPFRARTYRALGGPEETRRWVTLQAATVLKQAGM